MAGSVANVSLFTVLDTLSYIHNTPAILNRRPNSGKNDVSVLRANSNQMSLDLHYLCSDFMCFRRFPHFDLYGLILCVSEGLLSVLLCIHNVSMETFGLHELI